MPRKPARSPLPVPDDALDQDVAILGKKGRGKTFAAKAIVERLLVLDRRVLVLDPLSVWWGLRTSRDVERAGFPLAIFGGPHADMAISDTVGRPLGRLLAREHLPAIVDMGGMRKAQQSRLVADLLDELFAENTDPLWIVLEEADAFAPQQPMGDTTWRSIARMAPTRTAGLQADIRHPAPASLKKIPE